MIKEIIASGKDIIEAKENARALLGAGPLDDVNFQIIHNGSRGIFGIIGVKPAQVKAWIELPDRKEPSKKTFDKHKKEKKNHNNQNNKPKEKTEKKQEEVKPAQQKEVSKVIPEAELKMEKREVSDGDDMSFDFVKSVISDIGLNAQATLYSCEDGTRRIIIDGSDASTLIGHHGDTLDALQYLANLASARKNANGERDKSHVTIDIEGYRAKREETLRALARRMAQKAIRNRRSVMLEPMTPYERRIIHSEVQNIEGVSTNSIGSDNNRKIVIFLTDKKPKGIFEEDAAENEVTQNGTATIDTTDNEATDADAAADTTAEDTVTE